MYKYKAKLNRVIDGDTIDVKIDLGFSIITNIRVRLAGVDTYELNSPNERVRRIANMEKEYADMILKQSPYLIVQTSKTGKYGRWIGDVYLADGRSFNNLMFYYHQSVSDLEL